MPNLHVRFSLLALSVFGPAGFAAAELKSGAEIPAFAASARSYATTAAAYDFKKESVCASVTVTIKSGHGGNGCAFFGLGDGKPNPGAYGEPSGAPSLVFRLMPNDFVGGQASALVDGQPVGETHAGDGTHRLRLLWDASRKRALLEIHKNWKPGAVFKATSTLFVPSVSANFGAGTKLFVGGAGGVAFSDFEKSALLPEDLARLPVADFFRNDTTARTWLPVEGKSAAPAYIDAQGPLDSSLASLRASIRPIVCWYNGAKLEAARSLPGGKLEMPNSKWDSSVKVTPVAGEPDARDVTVSLTLKEGGALASGLAVAFDFTDWNTDNYVLVPASIYNGNRNRIENRGYCTGFDAADFNNKNLDQVTTSCPQLSPEPGKPSKFEVAVCNAATPAIGVYQRKTKRGLIVLSEQAGRDASGDFLRKSNGEIMDNAFSVEESPDRSRATLVVSAPGVRERKPAFIGFDPSHDRGMSLKTGDAVTLKLRVYSFGADGIPAYLEKFMAVRKSLTGPTTPRTLMPFSEAERRMMALTDGRYWYNAPDGGGFYLTGNALGYCYGWVGGVINVFPALAQGDDLHRARAVKSLDYAIKPSAQGASGLFLAALDNNGRPCGRDWYPHLPITLTRQEGDILFWTLKSLMLLKEQGRGAEIKPVWEDCARKLAKGLVTTWKKHGQWGNYLDHATGAPVIYGTTSGASSVGGLALAYAYFGEPEFLEVAKAAANRFYTDDFAARGFTFGACSDIMQNSDSETAAALMTSLATLYDVTGDKAWAAKARDVANLAATWTVSFDYELPKATELGAAGARLTGAVWASTQNKHGAPGFCTWSGDALLRIYRINGDSRYAELLRDIARGWQEGVKPSGNINERLTYCDAESRGSRGDPSDSTPWNVFNGALMAREIPGIHLRTDTGSLYVFDAIEAKVLLRDADGVRLEVRNPTKYDASVAILAENAAQAQKPLGVAAFMRWPRVALKAGETKTLAIGRDGSVR